MNENNATRTGINFFLFCPLFPSPLPRFPSSGEQCFFVEYAGADGNKESLVVWTKQVRGFLVNQVATPIHRAPVHLGRPD